MSEAALATVLIAMIGYRLVEQPILGTLKRLFLSRPTRSSEPRAILS